MCRAYVAIQRKLDRYAEGYYCMTSTERREARYKRRQEARRARKAARCAVLGGLEGVFTFRKFFFWGKQCCNGVRWKRSTQNFELHLFSVTARALRRVLSGIWKPRRCARFKLMERGKLRIIDSPHITDRQVEKGIAKGILAPLYGPCLIYDNGASQPGKGLHFAFRRLKEHLRWHFRRCGLSGGVLLLDLKGFFPNAPRFVIRRRHKELVPDDGLRRLLDVTLDGVPSTSPGRGMPLGVEPSQLEMIGLPSAVDHWLKCQAGLHCMAHYMDDYYIIHPDISKLRSIGNELVRRLERFGIAVNRRKCRIILLEKRFRYCKAKFGLLKSGRLIVNGCRDGVKRLRRKANLFSSLHHKGEKTARDIAQLFTSTLSYYANYNDNGRFVRIKTLCETLFGGLVKCTKSKAIPLAQ